MAVLAMKRINIYALKANRKKILELLQMKNAVDVQTRKKAGGTFAKTDTSSACALFEKNAQLLANAVAVYGDLTGDKISAPNMFTGRTPVSMPEYNRIAERAAEMTKTASRILSLNKKIADGNADIIRFETQIEALEPWLKLDISMRTISTKSTHVFIGSFPEPLTEGDVKARLASMTPDAEGIEVELISSLPQQTCVFVLCHAKYGMKVETALRSMGFTYPASPSKESPKERAADLGRRIEETKAQIRQAENEILSYKDKRRDMLYASDYYTARAEKYRVLGDLWQTPHLFTVTGFIPAGESGQLKNLLEKDYGAFVELEDPFESDDIPVKLKNNGYAAPVEGVVEGYSLPGRGEIDPCSVMAIFYYVLFGMMLSDAAYGFLIFIACVIILIKCKNMEKSSRNSIKMFMFSGISTIFWGVMFGSYFGDAIPVIAKTFFDKDIIVAPLWFAPIDEPMRLLVFSFLLGIIHLFTGLGAGLYQHLKNRRYKDALYDVVFWYFLVGGLILALLSTEMFKNMVGLTFKLPEIAGTISLIFAAIGAVGIIATAGRESRSPFKRLLKGLYGIYNISGYLSDILSYSRLLALGLATGVISSVFNQMGTMLGGGVGGAIFFAVVFLIGHAMNIAINALGAYVHSNRLTYVEFFGKFYDGGGKKFTPFATKTKYFKVTEEK